MNFLDREFEFLQDLFSIKCQNSGIMSKFELYRSFKYKFLSEINVTTTNVLDKHVKWNNLDIVFHYQRQNLFILDENKNFYNPFGLNRKLEESFYFTKNGQSANMIACSILKDHFKYFIHKATTKIYFETAPLINSGNQDEYLGKACLIDSSVTEKGEDFNDYINTSKFDIHFLDASCLDNNDPHLLMLIERIRKDKLPFIITKSHLKLDFCGGEYSQLGSISFFNLEKKLNDLRLNTRGWNDDIPFFGKLLYEMISLTGVMADTESIFPLFIDKNYQAHVNSRNNLIKDNCLKVCDSLSKYFKESLWKLEEYEHGQFFYITKDCKNTFPVKKLKQYMDFLQNSSPNYPLLYCDSFGFDFTSISYIGGLPGHVVLRICPGCIDSDIASKELKLLLESVDKIIKGIN